MDKVTRANREWWLTKAPWDDLVNMISLMVLRFKRCPQNGCRSCRRAIREISEITEAGYDENGE